jgi:hypothetical protein
MAANTAARDTNRADGKLLSIPVQNACTIYKGDWVICDTDGFAQTNDGTTTTLADGDIFMGIAAATVDNSSGSDGDVEVEVFTTGEFLLPCAATASQALVGNSVYINNTGDSGALAIAAITDAPECIVGMCTAFESTTSIRVRIDNAVGNLATTTAS